MIILQSLKDYLCRILELQNQAGESRQYTAQAHF